MSSPCSLILSLRNMVTKAEPWLKRLVTGLQLRRPGFEPWLVSRPSRFTPKERVPGTYGIGGRVGLRAGLDEVGKRKFLTPPGLDIQSLTSHYLLFKRNVSSDIFSLIFN
jgi:hypothetical protein